jgi:hypothetical protein
MITKYFAQFDEIINRADFITSSQIQKRKVNDFLGIIEGKIMIEAKTLDILEVILITNQQITKKKYKYHFQNTDNSLIFRYDNAPHHSEIKTFPHHQHLPGKIIACNEPNLLQIFSEISRLGL